jgi:Phosphodiester glycosidase
MVRKRSRVSCSPDGQSNCTFRTNPEQPQMQVFAAVLLLVLTFTATSVRGDWGTISVQNEPSATRGLEHRYLVMENSETGDRASIELAIFTPRSCRLRVIDQPAEPRVRLAEAMREGNCLAGVNGGYFDPDYKPIGLLIVDGRTIAPLKQARLLSGVLFATSRKLQILRAKEFSDMKGIHAAVQCGPMIVERGQLIRGLNDSRAARRTFAAIGTGNRAALGFCSDVTLEDLANILAAPVSKDFKIERALNLDGGSSSGFWFKRADGTAFSIREQKTVRDFVAIVPK